MLAAAVVLLSFGSAWAGVEIDPSQTQPTTLGNNGLFTTSTGSAAAVASTNVYIVDGATNPVVRVIVTGSGYTANETISADVTSAGWGVSVDGTNVIPSSGGFEPDVVFVLTRTAASPFSAPEDIVVKVEGSATPNTGIFTIKANPVPITLGAVLDPVTLFLGVDYATAAPQTTIDATPALAGNATFNWAGVHIDNTSGAMVPDDLLNAADANGIKVAYSNTGPTFTMVGTAAAEMAKTTHSIYAADLTITEPTGGFSTVPIAGFVVTDPIAKVDIAVSGFALTPDSLTFAVGYPVPDDAKVTVENAANLDAIKISNAANGTSTDDSVTWNGLTLKLDSATGIIGISGTPNNTSPLTNTVTVAATKGNATIADRTFSITLNEITVGGKSLSNPVIRNAAGNVVNKLIVDREVTITFDGAGTINNPYVVITLPNNTTTQVPATSTATASGTDSIVSFRYKPTMSGKYIFTIFYEKGGKFYAESFTYYAHHAHHKSGSGSCSTGFGVAGILALAGFALARRRAR